MKKLALIATICIVVALLFALAPFPGAGSASDAPLIHHASVQPTKVLPGDTMLVTAEVSDSSGIRSVTADMGGIETIALSLVDGTIYQGIWQSQWVVHDTEVRQYTTVIAATNTLGRSSYYEVTWSDPIKWGSYDDAARGTTNKQEIFNSAALDTVYMLGTGFVINHQYKIAYYDGNATGGGQLMQVDTGALALSDGSGILNQSQCHFPDYVATAQPGTWHAVVFEDAVTPPNDYNSIPTPVADDDFTVTAEAIPEFPTVLAGIIVAGLCFGIYYWMKRRLDNVKA